MIFSTNQARQLFVVTEDVFDVTNGFKGQLKGVLDHFLMNPDAEGKVWATEQKLWANVTSHKKMARTLVKHTVALDSEVNSGAPIAGQDYILTITLRQYPGLSVAQTYHKFAAVHATASMDAAKFYEELAKSLERNFGREEIKLFDFTYDTNGVYIVEHPQKWVRGTMPQKALWFEVSPSTVTYKGEEVSWGTVTKADSDVVIYNGKLMADLEYFCMGERADLYRGMGWPNVVTTEYLVDPTKAYDVIDIHLAYVGSNESVQKSEKTLTILVPVADPTDDTNQTTTDVVTELKTYEALADLA